MPIPFLNSITLNKNEIQEFKVYNLTPDPTLTSAGDYGYMWLNTSDSPKTLKWWDGTSIRSIVDSGNTSTLTVGTANDLSGGVAGSLPYQQGVGDTTFLGIGSSGYILTSTGSAPQWSASIPSSSVSGLAASATTDTTNASNISSGTLGLARLSLASGQFYVGDGSNNPAATAKSSIPLSGFGNAAADINIGGFKITNSGTIGSGDADSTVATKGYVDSVAQGLDVKASCLVATTADITLASPGAVTIDGIYSATDFTAGTTRILVKDQSAPAENGIYIWQGPSSAMTRSSDANTWDELVGAFTFVERGTANADSGWVCTSNAGGTLGSTAVTFVKFSQAGSYTAGNGIVQSGTSFNFAQSAAYTAGQIPFASSTTAMGFNANLHWDNANNRLGIGTATPGATLDVTSNTNGQNRLLLNNPSTGSGAYVSLDFTAGTSNNQILSMGSGYSGSFPYSTGALVIRSNNVNGIVINTSGSAAPITFGINDSTAMTLNGTGLGVGVVPTVAKFEANIENGTTNAAYFRTSSYSHIYIVGTSAGGAVGGSMLSLTTTGNKEWIIGQRTDTVYSSANSFFIRDNGGGATRLTIDSIGNVGISATTPAYKLHVNAANPGNGVIAQFYNNATSSLNGAAIILTQYGIADWYVGQPAGVSALEFGRDKTSSAAGTGLMRLTAEGNLGLGVTPSAWGAGLKALQVGAVSYGSLFDFGNGVTSLSSNLFFSGSSYGRMSTSSRWSMAYWQDITNGAHSWVTSTAAGTNASTPTMSTLMLLDASGNLLVGTASPVVAGVVVESRRDQNSASRIATNNQNSGASALSGIDFQAYGGSWQIDVPASATFVNPIEFKFNGTKRLSIKSTGQVNFVGLASDPAGAAGDVVYNSTSNRLKYHNGTAWVNTGTNKYSGALAGTGTSFTVTHNLGTRDVTVAVRKSGSTYDQVFTDVQMTDTNTVTIVFASSVTGSDYTVTVIG